MEPIKRILQGWLDQVKQDMSELSLKDNKQLRYLSQSTYLEEAAAPHLVRITMLIISAAVGVFLLWAVFTDINEVSSAPGQVIPSGYVRVVQHLEGGIVSDIMVEEGEMVKKGQLLVRLKGAGSEEDLSELQVRQLSLMLQAERLRAFVNNRTPNFSYITEDYPDLIRDQKKVYESMLEARRSEREVIKKQIEQKQEALQSLKKEKVTLQENVKLAEEAVSIKRKLMKEGLSSRLVYLDKQEALNTLKGKYENVISEFKQAEQELSEYKNRLESLDAKHVDSAYSELDQIEGEIARQRETMNKLENRVARLEVRAPVKGVVKGLTVNTIGGVVASGQKLMEIVPMEEDLVAEVRISPSAIGHIALGQPVHMKVSSYDFARYGALDGKLVFLSAMTFLDEETNETYYRGRVKLSKDYIGGDRSRNRILPGMTVQADIITGEKSVLAYLLKPIHVAVNTAFTEK